MDKLLLKPEEAALLLGIGRTKLYELLAIGAIESVRIGACRRIAPAALERYIGTLAEEVNPCGQAIVGVE